MIKKQFFYEKLQKGQEGICQQNVAFYTLTLSHWRMVKIACQENQGILL